MIFYKTVEQFEKLCVILLKFAIQSSTISYIFSQNLKEIYEFVGRVSGWILTNGKAKTMSNMRKIMKSSVDDKVTIIGCVEKSDISYDPNHDEETSDIELTDNNDIDPNIDYFLTSEENEPGWKPIVKQAPSQVTARSFFISLKRSKMIKTTKKGFLGR